MRRPARGRMAAGPGDQAAGDRTAAFRMRGRFSVRAARDLQRAQQHADAAPCGQRVAGRLLQEQAIAQQLRDSWIRVDDLDPLAHAAATQQIVEHQRGLDRRDAALMRHVVHLRKRDGDEHGAALDWRDPFGEPARGLVRVEMIARFGEALDALGRRHAARRDDEMVVAVHLPLVACTRCAAKSKCVARSTTNAISGRSSERSSRASSSRKNAPNATHMKAGS